MPFGPPRPPWYRGRTMPLLEARAFAIYLLGGGCVACASTTPRARVAQDPAPATAPRVIRTEPCSAVYEEELREVEGDQCAGVDTDDDGRIDEIRRVRGGQVIVRAIDSNNDAMPDRWVWTPDTARPTCAVTLTDPDGDRHVDQVEDPCGLDTGDRPPGVPAR